MIPYILTDKSLTVVIDGKAQSMNSEHPSWLFAQDALKASDWSKLEELFDVESAVEDYLDAEAQIEVKDGQVLYQGESMHNMVVDKILDFMKQRLPHQPLVKFLWITHLAALLMSCIHSWSIRICQSLQRVIFLPIRA